MEYLPYIVTTVIPTIAIIIVGFILKKQISSQKQIMEGYKDYIAATDWKKVKDLYEEVTIPKMVAEMEKDVNEQIDKELKELEPMIDEVEKNLKEAVGFAVYVCMLHLEKEEGQKLVKEHMPSYAPYFEKIWAWHDQHNYDHLKTPER